MDESTMKMEVPLPVAARAGTAVSPLWRSAVAFGGLWGAVELTLGPFLQVLRPPFAGTLMALGAVVLMAAARRMMPRPGLTAAAAAVAALLGSLAPGPILEPVLEIACEGLLMELAFLRGPRAWSSAALAGTAAALWPAMQQLAMQRLLHGRESLHAYGAGLRATAAWLGLSSPVIPAVLIALVPIVLGGAAGLAGWRLGGRALVLHRQREPAP